MHWLQLAGTVLPEQRRLATVIDDSSFYYGREFGQMMLRQTAIRQDMLDAPYADRHLVRDDSPMASPP